MADRVADLAAAETRALVRTVAGLLTTDGQAGVLEAIERAAQACAATIGLAAIAGVINWAGEQVPARAGCPREPTHTGRLVGRRPRTIRTLLGPLGISRGYYHCGSCQHAGGSGGFAPLDVVLGVTGSSLSPGLARAAALAGAEMPYAKGFTFIGTVTGLDLASTSTLARTTRSHGNRARALINDEHQHALAAPRAVPAAFTDGPELCYIVLDGTGAPMLPSETVDRAGKTSDRAGTREVKIGCLFTHLDLGNTDEIAATVDTLNLPDTAPDLVKPAATEVGYFTGNHHRMQYTDFKANGYYIGSGPVEAACNTIVKQRAKRAGMHWTIAGLDPILALRTLHQSRDHTLWPQTTPTPQT